MYQVELKNGKRVELTAAQVRMMKESIRSFWLPANNGDDLSLSLFETVLGLGERRRGSFGEK